MWVWLSKTRWSRIMKKFEVYSRIVYNVNAESPEQAKWAVENGEHNHDVVRRFVEHAYEVKEFKHD